MGTSAGALVGALLAAGRDVSDALAMLAGIGQKVDFSVMAAGDEEFMNASRQVGVAADPRKALQAISSAVLAADTPIGEDDYLGLFDSFAGTAWPAGFQCAAVNTVSGELIVWIRTPVCRCSARLLPAVWSRCCFRGDRSRRPLRGRRSCHSHLNATTAPPSDIAVVRDPASLGLPATERR